uniref:Uncharacterized protein n=1 Tax=Romanomermis culicivorax TaxID=13658 RepID=A0A915IFF3_ROMCU
MFFRISAECSNEQENSPTCDFDDLVDALQTSEIFSGNIRRLRIMCMKTSLLLVPMVVSMHIDKSIK